METTPLARKNPRNKLSTKPTNFRQDEDLAAGGGGGGPEMIGGKEGGMGGGAPATGEPSAGKGAFGAARKFESSAWFTIHH
jgi:hypothetical protein